MACSWKVGIYLSKFLFISEGDTVIYRISSGSLVFLLLHLVPFSLCERKKRFLTGVPPRQRKGYVELEEKCLGNKFLSRPCAYSHFCSWNVESINFSRVLATQRSYKGFNIYETMQILFDSYYLIMRQTSIFFPAHSPIPTIWPNSKTLGVSLTMLQVAHSQTSVFYSNMFCVDQE